MNLKVNKRDGPAKIGELTLDNKSIVTPNILFVDTARFKSPNFADAILTNIDKKTKKPCLKFSDKNILEKEDYETEKYYIGTEKLDLIILKYASQLFDNSSRFTDNAVNLVEKNSCQKAIYSPSIAKPSNLSLLSYLGIDLFDSTSAITAARNKVMLFSDGEYNINDLEELPCSCPICNSHKEKPAELSFENLLNHNYYALFNELKQVRNAIKKVDLRNLVEKRVKSNPNLISVLRNLDKNHYNFLEEKTPVVNNNVIYANSKESLARPEIIRFQDRIINRYSKPQSTKILLLLPCSAKKPYSFSKSHRFFREKIQMSNNPNIIHEVIVTSPMGIVPRELELVYPADSYDIPVTGIWDEDEKKMIRSLLLSYLKKNNYEKIIAHLPLEILDFTSDILKKATVTCVDHPTSKKSLEKLGCILEEYSQKYDKQNYKDRLKENIECLASYQFGKDAGKLLMKDTEIKGKYPFFKIMQDNKQLGMLTEKRGYISLTLNGADKIKKISKHCIEISDDFELVGSVFAPGVINADKQIRIGDEVLVFKNKKLCAVGVAKMNGSDMKKLNHGESVKTRHRI